jgi:tRNA (guanine-N7-)-methyltransferase
MPLHERHVRSYVLRAGRMGTGQQRALRELAPRYVLPFAEQPLDVSAAFGRDAPLILEIGFGMGDATAQIAAKSPHLNFLGIEVHPPGVGALLQHIEARPLHNVRIVQHDAVAVLQHMLAPESLAGAMVFFPDPWPKKRHHKRRIVQPEFAALAARKLAAGGILHAATDWPEYGEHIWATLKEEPLLEPAEKGLVTRPETKFESRGRRLGHPIRDLYFRRAVRPTTAAPPG